MQNFKVNEPTGKKYILFFFYCRPGLISGSAHKTEWKLFADTLEKNVKMQPDLGSTDHLQAQFVISVTHVIQKRNIAIKSL